MTCARLIYITTPSKELAEQIAESLINENLIACANILSEMNSLYCWDGQICKDSEYILILKTQESLVAKIKEKVLTQHSYDCPCFLVLPVVDGHKPYIEWLKKQTSTAT